MRAIWQRRIWREQQVRTLCMTLNTSEQVRACRRLGNSQIRNTKMSCLKASYGSSIRDSLRCPSKDRENMCLKLGRQRNVLLVPSHRTPGLSFLKSSMLPKWTIEPTITPSKQLSKALPEQRMKRLKESQAPMVGGWWTRATTEASLVSCLARIIPWGTCSETQTVSKPVTTLSSKEISRSSMTAFYPTPTRDNSAIQHISRCNSCQHFRTRVHSEINTNMGASHHMKLSLRTQYLNL